MTAAPTRFNQWFATIADADAFLEVAYDNAEAMNEIEAIEAAQSRLKLYGLDAYLSDRQYNWFLDIRERD